MIEELLRGIRHGKGWIDRFTRYEYRKAFEQYRAEFEPLYCAALQENAPEIVAEGLMDALEAAWKQEHFWNRGKARVDDKMMIVSYLTPMLLKSGEPRCRELAEVLCRVWQSRCPGDSYRTATFETLLGGFRHAIFGIDLEQKHIQDDGH